MLRHRAVPLIKVVLLDNGNGRDNMYESPKQYGNLAHKTDVVHRSYRLSCPTHPSRVGRDGALESRASWLTHHKASLVLPRGSSWPPFYPAVAHGGQKIFLSRDGPRPTVKSHKSASELAASFSMTSIPSTTASSVSSLDTHPDSRPTVSDLITPKLWNQRDPFRLTTANIRPTGRVLDEIPFSLHALSFTSGVESELYQSWPPVGQTVTNGSWTAPQSEKPKSGPAIYSTPNASSQRAVSSNSANSQAQLRELWYKFFLNGCWSNARSDFYAACLVYHGPWTDKSTSNLLAEMFRAQYTRAFTNPWVPNSGTSRIIEFLGVVEKQPKKGRGTLAFVEFRASVRQSALNTFHLSIDLVNPFPL